MKVKVVRSEKIKLRGKEQFITSLTLEASYLSLLRCKMGCERIRITRPDGTHIDSRASLDHVKPVNGSAFLTIVGAVDVPVGSEIEISPNENGGGSGDLCLGYWLLPIGYSSQLATFNFPSAVSTF